MQVERLRIQNFRGVLNGTVYFSTHTLLVGGNNVGKSTVCEALDLILGPDRIYRRPVVDEHDFYCGRYLDAEGNSIEIRLEAVLTDLSEEAQRRFHNHLRRWNRKTRDFIDEGANALDAADGKEITWALPVIFIGKYDKAEDDFIGNTFFDHPSIPTEEDDEAPAEVALAEGRTVFNRAYKRLCGFVFLRTLRTGSRALSLQRGSLLDTVLKLGGNGSAEMWRDTLTKLQALAPPIGDVERLKLIRDEIQKRMSRFVNLSDEKSTAFYASNLTREHLREVVRLFISTLPSAHLIPFDRLGTGSINLLVFALLTFIADLKGKSSVIFAMEEPEIALPPHTQRRVTRFVLREMGQTIVTSHSPYVIEQFDPEHVVIISRDEGGALSGKPIDDGVVKPKTYRTEKRQFAEAILSRAVLVVEGTTEASVFPAASAVMEASLPVESYTHLDLAGVTVFAASGDGDVPRYGPIFAALGKQAFGFYDKPNAALKADAIEKLKSFADHWESPEKGIENVLVNEVSTEVLHRFLAEVSSRGDYPLDVGKYDVAAEDAKIRELAFRVLKARKGDAHGYGAIFIENCKTASELPKTIRTTLESIHAHLAGKAGETKDLLSGD